MSEHPYILEKGSKKHYCPRCPEKSFVRYIDTRTGNYLPEDYGRCDREIKCGYFLNPYKNGYAKANWKPEYDNKTDCTTPQQKPQIKPKKVFIPDEELNNTLAEYEHNTFIQNLLQRVPFPFEVSDIEKIISLYMLGTVPETGAVCFPFIDSNGNVNAIQEKIFNHDNHTDKTKKYHTSWTHSRLTYGKYRNKSLPEWLRGYLKNEKKVSCLFGEHLLKKYPNNPIALVESPKTAIYGTLYFGFPDLPQNFIWLAVGSLSSLNTNKCRCLEGRNIILFPDLSEDGKAYRLWDDRAKEFQEQYKDTHVIVSDLLERLAPHEHKEQGKDIADYLIEQDWREYRTQPKADAFETIPNLHVKKSESEIREEPKKPFILRKKPEVFSWDSIPKQVKMFWEAGGRGGRNGWEMHQKKRSTNVLSQVI
jgi:hypothetical protein